MKKAGGIVALIAGVFAVLASGVTLLIGGVGGALKSEGSDTVIMLGWGGVAFSFLAIIFAAVAINSDSRWPGLLLMLCSVTGAILGGTLVAVFMALVFVGGLIDVISKRHVAIGQEP